MAYTLSLRDQMATSLTALVPYPLNLLHPHNSRDSADHCAADALAWWVDKSIAESGHAFAVALPPRPGQRPSWCVRHKLLSDNHLPSRPQNDIGRSANETQPSK